MTDFLTFLNTADLDTLTEIPGISRGLAGNITAARPFDFVEDALHVKGMGKNLLGRMQSYFEAEMNDSQSRAMIPVEEEAAVVPVEKVQPRVDPPAEPKPSFFSQAWQAIANFLIGLLKLVLTLVLIAAVIMVIYFYAVPFFRRTLLAPVQQNTTQIQQNTSQIEELSSQISAVDKDITALQSDLDSMKQRVGTIEKTIETQTKTLSQLEEIQSKLEKQIETGNEATMVELKREVMLTRALEYLARSRLYLSESNFGLSRQDVQAARDLVTQLRQDAPDYQVAALDEVLTRLDLALKNLPEFPVIAVNDVTIAWQILLNGLPQSAEEAAAIPTSTATPAPGITSTPTFEPTPAATATP